MSTQILTTKLYIPPSRPASVQRPRLIKWLNKGLHRKLTLISAPAGFGKTTLLSEWVADCGRPVAWLSLDESDNDLTRFLAYLIAALQTITPHLGENTLGMLLSPQPPPIDSVLTSLLNEVSLMPNDFLLVLDDYHLIDSKAVDDALTFLLDHLPPQMKLVIASREDPQFPLARLRARDQMTELRAADLRFTLDEASGFLNTVMGLSLSPDDITALETRTEGWIAGLQLAAISIQGHQDSTSFIQSFTGSHRFVLDYLIEEVLQQQPEALQTFLLHTSILERLCGALCEAVLDAPPGFGQETLHALEHNNLFVIPLDNERRWYRYHHLFADVLQGRLRAKHPAGVPGLHQRASVWYEQNDFMDNAIRHAFAADDFERAATLIERVWPSMRRTRQEAALLLWVKALPEALFRNRPGLCVGYAWGLLDSGELDAAESRLRDAERLLEAPSSDFIVADYKQFLSLPASIANARAYRAQALNDVSGTVTYARLALNLLPEDDYYERGTTSALMGLAYWTSGNLEAAYQSFAEGLDNLQKGGGILIRLGGTVILAHLRMAQGRLPDAIKLYEQLLAFAESQGEPVLKGTAEMYLGLGELYTEQGKLEEARQYLQTGKALGEQASLPGYEYMWCAAQARLKEIDRDFDGALELLDEARRLYYNSPIPNTRPIPALRIKTQLRAGRLPDALVGVQERGLSPADDIHYLHEYDHITLARVLITHYRSTHREQAIHDATGLLERLLQAAEAGDRMGSIIEILILLALTHHAKGDIPAALVALERALILAEPQGYNRIFVDEDRPMKQLLLEAVARGIQPDYIQHLLIAFETEATEFNYSPMPAPQPLIDTLSERELDVLRLFTTELSGPEIARELGVALSTIRTHTKSIFSKLYVTNRRAAVNRATELHLI